MRYFGSSGIRGPVHDAVTLDLALRLGQAVGAEHPTAVVGHDTRTTGAMLQAALQAGLLSVGCEVWDVGLVPTPTLALEAANASCGVMVTASHNPATDNGFKLWNPDGRAFDTGQMERLEGALDGGGAQLVRWDRVGRIHQRPGAVDRHIQRLLGQFPPSSLTVVVDCGSGAASHVTPDLLARLGCEVHTLHCHPDGRFPGRSPEPTEETLQLLCATVRRFGADLGIAHDGDADRMVAVDGKGRVIRGDSLLVLFAQQLEAKKVVVPVDASLMIEDMLKATVVRTRVGDVFVAEELHRQQGDFGGEASGTWIFPRHSYCPDGIYAAAALVTLAAEEPLAARVDRLPSYSLLRRSFKFDPLKRESVLANLEQLAGSLDPTHISRMDGLRLEFEEGWALLRPSGTEAKLRLTVEARTPEALETLSARLVPQVEALCR